MYVLNVIKKYNNQCFFTKYKYNVQKAQNKAKVRCFALFTINYM